MSIYTGYASCTMVDGDKKTPCKIMDSYMSERVGAELRVRECAFKMLTPMTVVKGVITPATYEVGLATRVRGREDLLFTKRTDGKWRLKGSKTAELEIGKAEVNQIFA